MLQSLGVVLIFTTAAAVVIAIALSLFAQPAGRVFAGAVGGAWLGIVIDATMVGAIKQLPVFGALFATPLLVALIASLTSREVRKRLLNVSPRLVVGLNGLRIIGVLFIALAYTGALSGPFPYFAGIGDIVTGLLAIPLAWRTPSLRATDGRVLMWNTIGALDLLVAVALGVTSGSPEVTQLPWALIPLFLVPCYMLGHAIIYGQILFGRGSPAASGSIGNALETPASVV